MQYNFKVRHPNRAGADFLNLFAPLLAAVQGNGTHEAADNGTDAETATWSPRVDIRELTDAFLIQIDLPGIEPQDIDISTEKGTLTLRGTRTQPAEQENERQHRTERRYGAFHRSFGLPESADADNIQATHKHGVLDIRIAKKAETKARRIEIAA